MKIVSILLGVMSLVSAEEPLENFSLPPPSCEVADSTPYLPPQQPYSPPGPPTPPPQPWLTGPLIAPPGAAYPYGDFYVQAYTYCTTYTGTYDAHWQSVSNTHNFFSLNPQYFLFFGLTPWMDIMINPQFFVNMVHHTSDAVFGDLTLGFDFQLLDPAATPYFPGIRFSIKELFPTGPFQDLNPSKLYTDQSGMGTFGSIFSLVLYKIYKLGASHWMSSYITTTYTINSPVHVHDLNTYGGGPGTSGTALPGNTFQGIISFEFTLNQNWVFAIDNVYTHTDATQFSGTTKTAVGLPSSEQISFAPAIEYNFSANFGIIAGCWFSAWGRNSTEFRSGVIEFSYEY